MVVLVAGITAGDVEDVSEVALDVAAAAVFVLDITDKIDDSAKLIIK